MRDKMEAFSEQSGEVPELTPEVAESFSKISDPQVLMDPNELDAIRTEIPEEAISVFDKSLQALREALGYSLEGVFFIGMAVILAGCLLTFFLREIPLRTSNTEEEKSKEAM
jgi:hypothetical protein